MADFVQVCPGQSTTMSISLSSALDVTGWIRVGSIQLGIIASKWADSRLGECGFDSIDYSLDNQGPNTFLLLCGTYPGGKVQDLLMQSINALEPSGVETLDTFLQFHYRCKHPRKSATV